MAKVAKAEAGTHVIIGNDVFDFSDGTRQVTEAEADLLKTALGNKVSIGEQKAPRKEKS